MSSNEQDLLASIDQALRKASLSLLALDREALLRVTISLCEDARDKAASMPALVPA